jgi:parallel beta-helix repeat protein
MNLKSLTARAGVAALLMGGLFLTTTGQAVAKPPTLYVSPSGTDVNNNCQASLNPCQTIDYALTQALSGATIKVQAGTYAEQVKITHPVTIVGAGANQTVIDPPAPVTFDADTDSTQPQFYVVDAVGTTGVNLEDLGINGSGMRAGLDTDIYGCGQNIVGAYYHDASGSMTNDTVTQIEMPARLFGCQGGLGVYVTTDSTWPTGSSLRMVSDNINNYNKNGITCDDPRTSCTITNTTVTGIGSTTLIAQNGIQVWAGAASLSGDVVTGNTYDGPTYSAAGALVINPFTLHLKRNTITNNDVNAYLLQDFQPDNLLCGNLSSSCSNAASAGTTFTVLHNHLSNATNAYGNPTESGFGDGLDLDSETTSTLVHNNTVDSNPSEGITLFGTTSVNVRGNTVRDNGNVGIYLTVGSTAVTANANTVQSNTISSSGTDGILADANTGGNTFAHNSIQLDGAFDAQDQSTGAGTAGTANTWTADRCTTSDPSGLCTVAGTRQGGTARAHSDAHTRRPTHRARPVMVR